jgi:hypothetical protein
LRPLFEKYLGPSHDRVDVKSGIELCRAVIEFDIGVDSYRVRVRLDASQVSGGRASRVSNLGIRTVSLKKQKF